MMERPRLLLADDHPQTMEVLRGLLEPEFDVIAAVQDGNALVQRAEELDPDVIVTDISMPGLDGIAAAGVILHHDPDARIIFVTIHRDSSMVACGLATGAMGYVLKLAAGDDLIPAVFAALRGDRYVSASLRYEPATAERL